MSQATQDLHTPVCQEAAKALLQANDYPSSPELIAELMYCNNLRDAKLTVGQWRTRDAEAQKD